MPRAVLQRLLVLVLASVVLFYSLAPLASAADTSNAGSVKADVTVLAAPPSVSFALYSDSSYTTTTTSITPQVPVYMKISVQTLNTMEEVSIHVDMFADSDATAVGTPPSQTNSSSYVTFDIYYDSNAGSWVLTSDTGGGSSWSIQFDPNQPLPDPSASSGDFYIIIVFGKTALEANTGDNAPAADWDIVVTATVAGTESSTAQNYGYTVYFYGEVTPQASSISFGSLRPLQSQTIQSVDGAAANTFQISILANGYYNLTATADQTWSTSDGYTITLTTTTPGDGQFQLLIDDEAADSAGTPLNGVPVAPDLNSAEEFAGPLNPTVNEQPATANIYMQITLGTNIHTGTYSGTVYIYAVDAN